jgi:hypothetical protein
MGAGAWVTVGSDRDQCVRTFLVGCAIRRRIGDSAMAGAAAPRPIVWALSCGFAELSVVCRMLGPWVGAESRVTGNSVEVVEHQVHACTEQLIG